MAEPGPGRAESLLATRLLLTKAERLAAGVPALRSRLPDRPSRSEDDEHLEDLLCTEAVATAWVAARDAPPAPEGESARRAFRLRSSLFLRRSAREARVELEARKERLDEPPPGGHAAALAREPDPAARRKLHDRWAEREARLAEGRLICVAAARDAALACGAPSLCDFLSAGHPTDDAAWCEHVEAGAITPLDEAVERAARARRLRAPVPLTEPEHAADGAALRWLSGHEARYPTESIAPVLRTVGAALGADPDSGGPQIVGDPASVFVSRPWIAAGDPAVVLGGLAGPAGLQHTLEAFGRAARAGFVLSIGGPAALAGADPAFAECAGVLFARLILSPAFRARFGPHPAAGLDADLRGEVALRPRAAWTYLYLARRRRPDEVAPPGDDSRRTLRRALGRPPAVDDLRAVLAADPRGSAGLRGAVLALLLEERLMSRWGRGWFLERRAGVLLRETWEAESGQTVESVADTLDLGTIEATPILDGFRP